LATAIEEITIVANYYKGGLVSLQKLFQPLDRVYIEMVGGLVEQQNIRRCQKQAGKTETILLAAGELLSFQRPHVAFKSEALQNRFRPGGIFKTTFELKLVL
jgi:hypothetical protein